jgi:hypothetical protein
MLKTTTETYTRRIYSEFEEEFKKQFTLTCDLLEANGINSTFFVKYMQSDRGATVVLNTKDSTITCRGEHFSGQAGFGPGRKKILLFRAEKILPMPIPLDRSGLNFWVRLGPGRAWAIRSRIL